MQIVLALVILALAAGLVWYGLKSRGAAQLMEETPTTPAGKIQTAGYYEVKGVAECDSPLHVPGSGEACIYYRHKITEYYEESVRNSDGEYETRQRSRVVQDDERSVYFRLRDRSGSIDVLPTGATFEGRSTSHGRRRDSGWGAEMGAFAGYHTYEDQGQRHTIESIPLGTDLYVLGRATRHGQNLALGEDTETGKPFLVSLRSEQEEIAGHMQTFYACMVGAGIAVLGAVYVLAVGF